MSSMKNINLVFCNRSITIFHQKGQPGNLPLYRAAGAFRGLPLGPEQVHPLPHPAERARKILQLFPRVEFERQVRKTRTERQIAGVRHFCRIGTP